MKKKHIQNKIETYAAELGFSLLSFTNATVKLKNTEAFNLWLTKKHHADMQYLEKKELRKNITQLLPNAKTVITLVTNYYYKQNELKKGHGRIARYARGRDYHKIIKKRLVKLEKYIDELLPGQHHKSYVDTGPVLERALAAQGGLGFIGKNSCLITKDFGSWVFISEIITSLDFETKTKNDNNSYPFSICGSCKLCIDACPTGAIIAPGVIDSNKCISYHTIENKGEIPKDIKQAIKTTKRVFGCDICQEVCPHNQCPIISKDADLGKKIAGDQVNAAKIMQIKDDQEYLDTFAGSPLMRAKRKGLKRNCENIK